MAESSAILRKHSAKKRKYSANSFRCLPFLIGLYSSASQSDSSIFTKQKKWPSFLVDFQWLKNGSKNKNTTKGTRFCLNVWKKWCVEKEIQKEIQDIPPVELNILLERFYAEVKTKQGEDCEPETLRAMLTPLKYISVMHIFSMHNV